MSEPLQGGRQSSHRAEINAAIIALDKVKKLLADEKLNTNLVLLAMDSQYVVKSITEDIYRWYDNGWINARGGEIVGRILRSWMS
jgi:ribonuclease HI